MNKVNSKEVTVYMDEARNTFPEGMVRDIDCNFQKVDVDTINTIPGGQCPQYNAGMSWPAGAPYGVTTVDTVIIATEFGKLWIAVADYTALVTMCNACCVS